MSYPCQRDHNPVLDLVEVERRSQDEKWGEQNHGDGYWLAILVEEVGEAAKALCERTPVESEVLQVAAVAVAWLECISRRRPATVPKAAREGEEVRVNLNRCDVCDLDFLGEPHRHKANEVRIRFTEAQKEQIRWFAGMETLASEVHNTVCACDEGEKLGCFQREKIVSALQEAHRLGLVAGNEVVRVSGTALTASAEREAELRAALAAAEERERKLREAALSVVKDERVHSASCAWLEHERDHDPDHGPLRSGASCDCNCELSGLAALLEEELRDAADEAEAAGN